MEAAGISLVLDVGANAGQFATELRKDLGYKGRLVSFEPSRDAFNLLRLSAQSVTQWEVVHGALGDFDGTMTLNVSGNSYSSSFMDMLPAHVEAAPQSRYVGQEDAVVVRLDTVFDDYCQTEDVVYLKIDAQGFEERILQGAIRSLHRIRIVQLEMSLTPMYAGELPFGEMHGFLASLGYKLVSLEGGFTDESNGRQLQVDGIYERI